MADYAFGSNPPYELVRPGVVNPHSQHDEKSDQHQGHRAAHARLRADEAHEQHCDYGEEYNRFHEV